MKTQALSLALVLVTLALALWLALPFTKVAAGAIGNPNVSVQTRVNITNSAPFVANVSVSTPITLIANTTALAQCNVSVSDFNNRSDIAKVNITFWSFNYSTNLQPDFNLTHYSNETCTNFTDDSPYTKTYYCTVNLNYNAQAGNWTCNATVFDAGNVRGTGFASARVSELLAIGVGELIDFGSLAVENTSFNVPFNVTNYGNIPLNVSVFGYGRAENDTLAMACDNGNISIENLRVSANATEVGTEVNFNMMMQLNNTNATRKQIPALKIPMQNNSVENATNTTIWRLFAASTGNPSGQCNGTVVFTAERS